MKSPEDVIDRLVFQKLPEKCAVFALVQEEFQERLKNYVRGKGHVLHPELTGHYTPEEIERARGDELIRARYLLLAFTATVTLPIDRQKFKARFLPLFSITAP